MEIFDSIVKAIATLYPWLTLGLLFYIAKKVYKIYKLEKKKNKKFNSGPGMSL